MDPILTIFIATAIAAIVFLVVAIFHVYIAQVNVGQQSPKSAKTKQFRSVQITTETVITTSIGLQYPEKQKTIQTTETGCDAAQLPIGATVTEQIEEFRKLYTHLHDLYHSGHGRIHMMLDKLKKDTLEQAKLMHKDRDAKIDLLQTALQDNLVQLQKQNQQNFQKLQESMLYEIKCETNKVIQRLLPPPPPPLPPPPPPM